MKNRTFLGIKLACYCILFVMVCAFSIRFMGLTQSTKLVGTMTTDQHQLTGKEEYDGINKLKVDITSYGIEVESYSGSKVSVEYYGVSTDRLIVTVKDNQLLIQQDDHKKFFDWRSGKVVIKVPSQLIEEMILETVSGSINVDALAEDIKASSVSGSVRVSGQGNRLVASSVSGSVRNLGDFETVEARSTSGSVRTTATKRTNTLELQSVSGSIRISLAEGVGYDMNYSSISGSVKDEYQGISYKGVGECTYGNKQVRIHAGTTSGSIRLTNWE